MMFGGVIPRPEVGEPFHFGRPHQVSCNLIRLFFKELHLDVLIYTQLLMHLYAIRCTLFCKDLTTMY